MQPHSISPSGSPNGASRIYLDSLSDTSPVRTNPHRSPSDASSPAFAPNQCQRSLSPAVYPPGGRHNSVHATPTPISSHLSLPYNTYSRADGPCSDASSTPSPQTIQKQSRVPPNTVARKAPRKSTAIPVSSSQQLDKVVGRNVKHVKPRLNKTGATLDGMNRSPAVGRKPRKDDTSRLKQSTLTTATRFDENIAMALGNGTPGSRQSAFTASAAAGSDLATGPLIQEQYDKIFSDVPSTNIPKRLLPENIEINTPKEEEVVPIETQKDKETHAITTRRQARIIDQPQPQRPQSQYKYNIPHELAGVRRALGKENWAEYLTLVERYAMNEISDKDFEVEGRRMFHVINARTQSKITDIVLQCVKQIKDKEKPVA